MLKRNPSFAVFRRAVDASLTPVWPEKWPREKLLQRRREIGAASFARGYHLTPVNEAETPIKPGWVRFWTTPAVYECVALSVDPAVTASGRADASALVVLGRLSADRGEGLVHVLEAAAHRVAAPELVGLIDDAAGRWSPDVVLFESNAAFAGLKDLLVRHARFGPRVRGVVQTRDKGSRLSAFGVPVANGSVRLKGSRFGGVDPAQLPLFEELTTFPFAPHDDLADATATGGMWLLDRREPRAW